MQAIFALWQIVSVIIALIKTFLAIVYSFCAEPTEDIG